MGTELEWKLRVPKAQTLEQVLRWPPLTALQLEQPRLIQMRTTYYDTEDRRLSAQHCTLRRRLENDRSVVTAKAPVNSDIMGLRGEWETEASAVAEALPALRALGAPACLTDTAETGVVPVCSAAFLRRAVLLGFPDGSRCELALDLGELRGVEETMPLCELELELKEGPADLTLCLYQKLRLEFGLEPEPLSKFARARSLD